MNMKSLTTRKVDGIFSPSKEVEENKNIKTHHERETYLGNYFPLKLGDSNEEHVACSMYSIVVSFTIMLVPSRKFKILKNLFFFVGTCINIL